jgi:hypothetical protein
MIEKIELQQLVDENPGCFYNYISDRYGERFILFAFNWMELLRAYSHAAIKFNEAGKELGLKHEERDSWRSGGNGE